MNSTIEYALIIDWKFNQDSGVELPFHQWQVQRLYGQYMLQYTKSHHRERLLLRMSKPFLYPHKLVLVVRKQSTGVWGRA